MDTSTIIYRERPSGFKAREEFFLNRVIPHWNELDPILKNAESLNSFKAGLDKLDKFSV